MNKTTRFGRMTAAVFVSTANLALAEDKPPEHRQAQLSSVGQEPFDGKVVAVDKTNGTVRVEATQHGQLKFKLTPAQVLRLNEGEQQHLQIQIYLLPKRP